GSRKSCSHTHHISLCDTTVNMALRKLFPEHNGLRRICQVSIQDYQILMFPSQLHEGIAVAVAGSNFLHLCHNCSPAFSSSAIAWAYCSSFGAFPCQSTLFSIKETPLPFSVLAIIAVGIPFTVLASANAAASCSKSFPSATLITWKLNASNFLSIGYGELTSSMLPSVCKLLLSTITTRLSSLR